MKTNDELIEEFKKKREDLKDWLYGTVYKGYDQEELAGVVQEDVDRYFTDEWFKEVLTQKDAEARDSERNRIFSIMRGMGVKFDGGEVMKTHRKWEYTRNKHASEVTNEGDTNN